MIRDALRSRRLTLGLSALQVVRLVSEGSPEVRGFTPSSLRAWETGSAGRSPSDVQLQAWARALGLEVELRQVGDPSAIRPTRPTRRPRAA